MGLNLKKARASLLSLILLMLLPVISQALPSGNSNVITNIPVIGQQELPREETLIVPMNYRSVDPTNFNPFLTQTHLRGPGTVFTVHEHLIHYVSVNDKTYYWLASGYQYNENFTVFTLNLRSGIKWNNGVPFNTSDIEFTFNMLKANPALPRFRGFLSDVNRTEIVNATTIKFHLNSPNKRYHRNFIGEAIWIVPKHIWANVTDPVAFKNNPPMDTGPYTLLSVSSENVIWKRNDDYWGKGVFGLPKPKYVVFTWVGPPNGITELTMMKLMKHEIEQGRGTTSPQLEMMKGVNPYISSFNDKPPYFLPSISVWAIAVNLDKYPFNYSEVRWAISYALDRQKLVDIAMPGSGLPADSPGYWTPLYKGLDKWKDYTLFATYNVSEYNPQKSIALLEGLGFKRGADGIFVTPNGTRLSFLYLSWDGPLDRVVQPLTADMLKKVGIEVEVKFILSEAYWPTWAGGNYEMFRDFQAAGDPLDPYYSWWFWHNRYILPRGVWAYANRIRWNNTEFSTLVDQMFELDPILNRTVYERINNKLLEIWLKELPLIGQVYFADLSVAYDEYYWTGWPNKNNPYATGADWYADFGLVLFNLRPNRPPADVSASTSDVKVDSLKLSWTESTHAYFARYEVFRSTASGVLGTSIGNVTTRVTTSQTVSGLSPGTTYYFTVRVWNTEGKYTDSTQVSTVTATPPTPFYQETWFLAGITIVIVVVAAAAIVLRAKK